MMIYDVLSKATDCVIPISPHFFIQPDITRLRTVDEGPIVILQSRRPLTGAEGPVRGILHDLLRCVSTKRGPKKRGSFYKEKNGRISHSIAVVNGESYII